MAKTRGSKMDYASLKLEFFQSDFKEIYPFLRHKLGTNKAHGNIKRATVGWTREKQEWKEKIIQEALKQMEKEAIKVWKPNMEQVSDVYKNIFNLMIEYSNQLIGEGNKTIQKLNIKDLRNFWEMIRTEMGEPIRILKQENTIEPPNSDPLKQRLQDLQDKTKQKCENSSLKKKSKK